MKLGKGVPPKAGAPSQGSGAAVSTISARLAGKVILGRTTDPISTGQAGLARPATLDHPSVRPINPMAAQVRPSFTVTDVVDTLRNGGALDSSSIAAIADGINAKFEQLRNMWGGKLYFTPAEVFLFDDHDPDNPDPADYTMTYLAFRKQDKGWNFVLEEVYANDTDGDPTILPLASAPLDVRLKAIAALPKLEDELKKERDALARALVKAYDSLTSFVEKSATPGKETSNGTA